MIVNSLFEVPFISAKREQELQELRQLIGITVPLTGIPLKRECENWVKRKQEFRRTTVTKRIPLIGITPKRECEIWV